MLKKLKQTLIRAKYKRKGLNIIENIPFEQAKCVLEKYEAEGWELAPEFVSSSAFTHLGKCTIRRGQSTLLFTKQEAQLEVHQASITGSERIIGALAKQLDLCAKPFPSF